MILEIVQYGHPILRTQCQTVPKITAEIKQLTADMLETMYHAQGIGLAAPQINQNLQLAIVDVSHDPESCTYLRVDGANTDLQDLMPLIFLNPDIQPNGPITKDLEGCLSIQGIRAEVPRPEDISATLTLLDGRTITLETDGLLARAIQHETDHLHGTLFTDHLPAAKRLMLSTRLKHLAQKAGYPG